MGCTKELRRATTAPHGSGHQSHGCFRSSLGVCSQWESRNYWERGTDLPVLGSRQFFYCRSRITRAPHIPRSGKCWNSWGSLWRSLRPLGQPGKSLSDQRYSRTPGQSLPSQAAAGGGARGALNGGNVSSGANHAPPRVPPNLRCDPRKLPNSECQFA